MFIGRRPVRGEVFRALALVPVILIAVSGLVLALRTVAPWMHTVEKNPLETITTLQDPLLVISNGRIGLDRLDFARSSQRPSSQPD